MCGFLFQVTQSHQEYLDGQTKKEIREREQFDISRKITEYHLH